jgi:hypothetical protein
MKKAAHPMDRMATGCNHGAGSLWPSLFADLYHWFCLMSTHCEYPHNWKKAIDCFNWLGVHVQICSVFFQCSQGSWLPYSLWKPWTRFVMFGGMLIEHKNLQGAFHKMKHLHLQAFHFLKCLMSFYFHDTQQVPTRGTTVKNNLTMGFRTCNQNMKIL